MAQKRRALATLPKKDEPIYRCRKAYTIMHENQDLISTLRMDLAELTTLHAPSGAEQPVIARLRDLFTPLVDTVQIDHMGNLTATREGPPEAPHIVVSAHADEIGALVARIEQDGFLRLAAIGGV